MEYGKQIRQEMTMPKFQYFDENQKLIEERQEPMDEKNLQRYLEQHGKERTLGYMEALKEITEKMDIILYWRDGIYSRMLSDAQIRKHLNIMYELQSQFLKTEEAKKIILELNIKPE